MISQRRFTYSASVFTTLLLCWLPAIAQTSSAQEAKSGTIGGRVVNESGRPLPNAGITLRRLGSMTPETISTITDREGKFELSGLPRVSYQVFAFLQGYAPVVRDGLNDANADVYHVGDSVTLVLTKGGVITGTVTNQAGEPVVGVKVRAQMVHTANVPFYSLFGQTDLTDDRGIYRIYGLTEGTYIVSAGGGNESGYSTDQDPFESDVPTYAPASTRDTAEEIVVRAGAESNGVDIQYRGESGHTVSGTVSGPNDDQPLGFAVSLVSAGGLQSGLSSMRSRNRGFSINGVDDGDYNITAMSFRNEREWLLSAPKQIKVRGADVTGVELVVQPLSSVTGRVVLEETKITECSDKQRPVFAETLVSAQNASATLWPIPASLWTTVNADEQGTILLKNLPSGRYYFNTQYFAKDWYLKSLSFVSSETPSPKAGKTLDAARTWTTLKPGDRLNGLTITLAQGAASLRGQVTSSKGETPAQKLYVYLIPAEKEMVDDPLRFYGAAVTAEGKVALNNLAPGRYLVFAQEVTDESVSQLKRLQLPDETAYRNGLRRKAETVKTEIELKPCQKVTDLKVRVSL